MVSGCERSYQGETNIAQDPLDIDLVEDVETGVKANSDAFDGLVLPEEHKRMVRALVQSHAMGSRSVAADDPKERAAPRREMDAVRGKGKGLVILLHGVPGVGKTSTGMTIALYRKLIQRSHSDFS